MSIDLQETERKLPSTPWGFLPPRMRVLFVTGTDRTGSWLAEAFAADSASEVLLEEAVGVATGLARLRDEIFDTVLVGHESVELDALELLDAIRAGSSDDQPIIVLGQQSDQEMAALCFEAGADAYVCVNSTTTRTLIWLVARAMERHRLLEENRRLDQVHQHRLQMEHDEATRLLAQQRQLISGLESIRCDEPHASEVLRNALDDGPNKSKLPDPLVSPYREVLRAYVIMGSGNLSEEMEQLADLFATAGVTATQAMLLHLEVLEEMVRGLGSRSARHVMSRADLLILEMIINLAEGYRERLMSCANPLRQMKLPGFEAA